MQSYQIKVSAEPVNVLIARRFLINRSSYCMQSHQFKVFVELVNGDTACSHSIFKQGTGATI